MSAAHTIRLRQPWRTETNSQARVVQKRHFNKPTGLDDTSEVWLVAGELPTGTTVIVNGVSLGEVSNTTWQAEITAVLLPRNLIELQYPAPVLSANPPEQISLEIRQKIESPR